jgi:glycosyltransferase involved in cell wall biosynthesis
MSMKSPKYKTCSVLMSVYKNDKPEWLEQAIKSILNQTLKSDDIVIMRDGKVDAEIEKVLKKYEKRKNVRVVRLRKNGGLAHALNAGLKRCRNKLVARMDADDIMVRRRLRLQVSAFNKRPELDILGGQIAEFDGSPENITGHRNVPQTQDDIKKFARLRCPFNHPSVMFKKSTIKKLGGYDETIGKVEDYELWMRALNNGAVMGNLAEVVCYLRAGDYMLGRRKSWQGCKAQIRLRWRFLRNKWISFADYARGSLAFLALAAMPAPAVRLVYNKGLRQ